MIAEKDLMKLANGSDVRGVAVEGVADEPVNLTPEAANRITSAFVHFLTDKTGKKDHGLRVAVGHDCRISSPALKDAALEALTAAGVVTVDCGLASTPAMFMTTVFKETEMDGAIMITASHLPYNRNGLKFFTTDGGIESADVKKLLEDAGRIPEMQGDRRKVQSYNLMERYGHYLRKKIRKALCVEDDPLKGLHIVVDAGNGNGGFFVTQVLGRLGADTSGSVYLDPDGHFPNHIPNPENKQAMASIREAVLKSHADLGLIFDTDVDRMGAVLANGKEICRNELIALMAAILAPQYPGSTIVTDSVTSDELTDFLENELGLKHHRYMRGYRNVIDECQRLNEAGTVSPLAIETSGHGAIADNYYLDDGAYLAVLLIIAAAQARRKGKKLSSLIKDLGAPLETREVRMSIRGVEDAHAYAEQVIQTVEKRAREQGIKLAEPNYEGIRFVFPHGWALLRASLHDAEMPLNIESRKKGGVAEIAATIKGLLGGFDALGTTALDK